MNWLKLFFKKKQQPIESPKYEQVIVLEEEHVVVRSRISINHNLQAIDPNYALTLIKEQVTKDIINQITTNPQLIEWVSTYDMGVEWVEGRIKIIPNK